jgi:hypothetical protein
MRFKPIILLMALPAVVVVCWLTLRVKQTPNGTAATNEPTLPAPQAITNSLLTRTSAPTASKSRIRLSAAEFSGEQRAEFTTDFERKFKPAISNWANAFAGHLPLAPEQVQPEQLVERIGRDSAYFEYVFVVDGMTLGVQDKNGVARVDYLNAPQQTRKLAALPDGSQAPVVTTPLTRQEVMRMVQAEGGRAFGLHEVRMTPSGFSGGLNGGALVNVGGDPENAASWNYDMVFDPDAKLAFYLKGIR